MAVENIFLHSFALPAEVRVLQRFVKVTIRPGFSRTVLYFWVLSWILLCPGFEIHKIWSVGSQQND